MQWPTATATDAKSSARHGYDFGNPGTTLLDAVRGVAVSNERREGGDNLASWATPRATEGEKGGPNGRDGSGSAHLAAQASRWATPQASDSMQHDPVAFLERKRRSVPGAVTITQLNAQVVSIAASDEKTLLNPVFVEALMGWPLGWTDPLRPSGPMVPFPPPPKGDWAGYLAAFPGTEPAVPKGADAESGASRTDRLRACGNGVVPQQAEEALCELFDALCVGGEWTWV